MRTGIFHRFEKRNKERYKLHAVDFRDRVIAQLIDGIILGVLCGLVLYIFSNGEIYSIWAMPFYPVYLLQVVDNHVFAWDDWWWGGAYFTLKMPIGDTLFMSYPSPLFFFIYGGYYTLWMAKYGQTPGKMLKKLVVLRNNENGITLWLALLRWISYTVSFIPLGIGFLAAAREGNRAWHDRVVHTEVYSFEDTN